MSSTANITVVVSIGRGAHASQQPLDDRTWQAFRNHVRTLLTEVVDGTVHVDDAQSRGEWNNQPEDSSTYVAEVPVHGLAALRNGLRFLATIHGQEAIALTTGHTEFVTP